MTKKIFIIFLLLIIPVYFYLNLFRGAIIDDAFITLRYVKTLLASGTWGFFPGHITNTATSPFNVILIFILALLTGSPLNGAVWLDSICMSLMTIILVQISIRLFNNKIFGYAAAVAVIFNPLLISTLGLESILVATLLVASIYALIIEKYGWLAIILGLLTITRAEGILYFSIFLIFIPINRTRVRTIIIYLLCILPWFLFSWIVLGSIIPDTFFLKIYHSWGNWFLANGIALYLMRFPLETIISFAFLPLLLVFLNSNVRKTRIILLIGLLGIVHFIGYTLLIVPPYHWYYVPEIMALILLGSFGLGVIYQSCKTNIIQRKLLIGVICISFVLPIAGMVHYLIQNKFIIKEMPIHTNWATQEQYRATGLWLKDNAAGSTILLSGEIGTLSYYCDCKLMEYFSDRRWLIDDVNKITSQPGLIPTLFKINFLFLPKYEEYPSYQFRLTGFTDRNQFMTGTGKKWETSTKWTPFGFLLFIRY